MVPSLIIFYPLSNSPHQQVRKAWLQDRDVVGWRHCVVSHLFTRGELASLSGLISCTKNIDKVAEKDFILYFVSWNVRSLVDVDGPPETACVSAKTAIVEERKIDLVVRD